MERPRVLMADDEEGIRESVTLILTGLYDLEYAKDGQEALDKLRQGRFDLLMLDLKMPKLDGFEVMRRLRSEGIHLPIVVLTAYQSVGVAKDATNLGIVEYLPKPFEREHVLRVIADSLGKFKQRRQRNA